jgi:hypothetical protein
VSTGNTCTSTNTCSGTNTCYAQNQCNTQNECVVDDPCNSGYNRACPSRAEPCGARVGSAWA